MYIAGSDSNTSHVTTINENRGRPVGSGRRRTCRIVPIPLLPLRSDSDFTESLPKLLSCCFDVRAVKVVGQSHRCHQRLPFPSSDSKIGHTLLRPSPLLAFVSFPKARFIRWSVQSFSSILPILTSARLLTSPHQEDGSTFSDSSSLISASVKPSSFASRIGFLIGGWRFPLLQAAEPTQLGASRNRGSMRIAPASEASQFNVQPIPPRKSR